MQQQQQHKEGNLDKKRVDEKVASDVMCAPDISFETGRAAKNPFNMALGNVEEGWGVGGDPLENLGFILTQFRLVSLFVASQKLEESFMSSACPSPSR